MKSRRPSLPPANIRHALRRAYRLARASFGHQRWWPAKTPFEVCVGAILTQNTSWSNVERALQNLRDRDLLEPHRLFALPIRQLAELLKPAGYFNVKAQRLRAFLSDLISQHVGRLDGMLAGPTARVRARLLQITGVGPETADSMLLYAGNHLSFVIDTYTRRIFARHSWADSDADYEQLRSMCEAALKRRPANACLDYWRDYHAQLVMIGKHYCRSRYPRCPECPLQPLLCEWPPRAKPGRAFCSRCTVAADASPARPVRGSSRRTKVEAASRRRRSPR